MNIKLMTHMIAGFPKAGKDAVVAKALIAGGADFLEVQFPFSDPSADGPVIQNACAQALSNGFKVKSGFQLVSDITAEYKTPVFIMTYAAMAVANGVEQFVMRAKESGAQGLIVPDLPPFEDEGIYDCCKSNGLHCIPVVAPSIEEGRLQKILGMGGKYIYTALRAGITGTKTAMEKETQDFLKRIRKYPVEILAGFGIQDAGQIRALENSAHCAIVGSALVQLTDTNKELSDEALFQVICGKVKELKGL
jgi:tryptophan synthase alpha chain